MRVGGEVHVVPGPRDEPLVVADVLPGFAKIVRAVQPALVAVLDERPHATAFGRRGRHAHLAEGASGQTGCVCQLGPGFAAVGRLIEAAVFAAARDLPKIPVRFPNRRVKDARVLHVDAQIHRARLVAAVKNLFPGFAAVSRFVDAALTVRAESVAERRYVHSVGVARVNPNLADKTRVFQAHVSPGSAAVGRLVNPVAVRHVDANRRLAHARVNHVRVAFRHGQRRRQRRC